MINLALKYRPKNFNDIVGQIHASQTLKNSITSGSISHAYLFYGSRGIGKTSMARIVAKSLNCVNGPTLTPCEVCDNCRGINQGNHVDVVEMDAASNRGIEHIRELRENVRFSPMSSRYKIYIIDEVHMLTNESFNALLKTLEEPPEHVVFILATTEFHKIPETIISRCQNYPFKKFSLPDITNRLSFILDAEKIPFEEDALGFIAAKAEGSMRDGISILDSIIAFTHREKITLNDIYSVLGTLPAESYANFLDGIKTSNLQKTLREINSVYDDGLDLKRFVWDVLDTIKNIVLLKNNAIQNTTTISSFTENARKKMEEMAQKWDGHELIFVFNSLFTLYNEWNMFPSMKSGEIRAMLEIKIVQIMESLKNPSLSQVLQKLDGIIKKINNENPPDEPQPVREDIKPDDTSDGNGFFIQKEFLGTTDHSEKYKDIFKNKE